MTKRTRTGAAITEPHDDWIEAFNEAAELARDLEEDEALRAYLALVDVVSRRPVRGEAQEFLTTVKMRAAYCAMDLARYDDALALLTDARATIDALDVDERYELCFALGNTLGNLGRLDEMYAALVQAISYAEDLDDFTDRPGRCWAFVLQHAAAHGAWAFVVEKAQIAASTARLRGIAHLEAIAAVRLDEARRAIA